MQKLPKKLSDSTIQQFEHDAKSNNSIPANDVLLLIEHIRYLERKVKQWTQIARSGY